MSAIATAIVGSAVLGAVGTYLATEAQKEGVEKGIAAEERTTERNIAWQKELTEMQRDDFAPWRDAGQQALGQIQQGIDSGDFEVGKIDVTQDPGYQFRMDQGIKARDASASARGRVQSGAQKKAIANYSQGLASQEYANAYAREADKKARKFNILSGMAGQGQASAAGQAGATSQLGQSGGNILQNLGRGQNIAQTNIGGARASGYQGAAQTGNQALQNWMVYKNS